MIPGISEPQAKSHVNLGPGQKAYLRGKRWLGQRTPEGIQKAMDDFAEAIELDPGYAPAYADLSSAYALALSYRYEIGMDGYEIAARSLAMATTRHCILPGPAIGRCCWPIAGIRSLQVLSAPQSSWHFDLLSYSLPGTLRLCLLHPNSSGR